MTTPRMFAIRRLPSPRSRDRNPRRVAVIEAATQREALEAFARAERIRAGWEPSAVNVYSARCTPFEWSGTGGYWRHDDGKDNPQRDWRLSLRRSNGAQVQRATYVAWRQSGGR